MSSTILLTDTIFNVILSVSINALLDVFSYLVNDMFEYALFLSFTIFKIRIKNSYKNSGLRITLIMAFLENIF